MFRGTFKHTIDGKGRLSIPSKYRELLETRYELPLYVTLQEDHLIVFPADEWRVFEAKFNEVSVFDNKLRMLQRHFYSMAHDVTVDKAGRILLPQTLREQSGLDKNVLICGMVNTFEIWDPERYEKSYDSFVKNSGESFAAAREYGI
ncbi:MAG: division/cell wall cluster transcriptional repressor MraZ [Deltaproteobacteria bacterium]|nr:MAG: division/cell wall cluster transcriptional repressor MraZ [Deltaproteobacteria bacterium]